MQPFFTSNKLPLALAVSFALSGTALAQESQQQSESADVEKITVLGHQTSILQTEASNGALGSRLILDTPFSISSISSEEMERGQVNSLETLFTRDASVTIQGGAYSGFGTNVAVRGLALDYTNSFKINGLSANNFSGEMPYEAFGKIDLLKGATGFMYGFAAPGGVINYTTKRATADLVTADVGYRTGSILYGHVDAAKRFGHNGAYGARVNVVHESGDTYNDRGELDRSTATLAFDAQLTDDLYFTLDVIYNDRRVDNVVSYLNNSLSSDDVLPAPVDGSRNIGVDGSFNDHENLITMSSLNWTINSDWNARIEYGHTTNDTRWVKTMPYLLNSEGDISIRIYDQYFDVDFDQVQGIVEGNFKTGQIGHQLISGVSYQKTTTFRNDPNRVVVFLDENDNLYEPNVQTYESTLEEALSKMWATTQKSAFVNDFIALNDQWSVMAGLRFTDYDYEILADIYKARLDGYSDSAVTPTIALMFKPDSDTTYYASYVEAFEEGSTVAETYENANEVLPPLKSKQYEAGVKVSRELWSVTGALFRIERAAEYATTDNYYVQDGVTVYQGLELNGLYQMSDNLSLYADLMVLDTEYDKTGPDSTTEGNDVAGAPDMQFGFQGRYSFPTVPGLVANIGAKYYGSMALDANNTWELDDYTIYTAGLTYDTQIQGKAVTFTGVANNLNDEKYWATDGYGGLRIGAPRTVSVNVKVAF